MKIKNFKNFCLNENSNIDYVLDKINNHGIESLTDKDKQVLDGIYEEGDIAINDVENSIFGMLCDGEEDDNILFDMEEEYDIHSSQIIPILEYCKIVFDRVDTLLQSIEGSPTIESFFDFYESYNTNSYSSMFGSETWIIVKSFKESFETVDCYFDDDEFDIISEKFVECFKI